MHDEIVMWEDVSGPCMYSSTGLLNQIILDPLADWAVQAGRNQINQIFVKYPHFSSNKFIFLTLKPQIFKNSLYHWGPHYHIEYNETDT